MRLQWAGVIIRIDQNKTAIRLGCAISNTLAENWQQIVDCSSILWTPAQQTHTWGLHQDVGLKPPLCL